MTQAEQDQRNQAILTSYKTPKSLLDVGKEFSLSLERVRQIIKSIEPDVMRPPGRGLGPGHSTGGAYAVDQDWLPDQTAFVIRNYGTLSQGQMAKKIGMSRNAVAGKIHRLKKRCLIVIDDLISDAADAIHRAALAGCGKQYPTRLSNGTYTNIDYLDHILRDTGIKTTLVPDGEVNVEDFDAWMKANRFINIHEGSRAADGRVVDVDFPRNREPGDIVVVQESIGAYAYVCTTNGYMVDSKCLDHGPPRTATWSCLYRYTGKV